jgi:membrane-associated protein
VDATRKGTWLVGGLLLAAVAGGIFLVGPERISGWFKALHDVKGMVAWGGYSVLAAIIFAETGLLVGFFLPGDSLLVTAGVFARTGLLDIVWLNVLLIPVAILGDAVNYSIGRRTGPLIFRREDGVFFKKAHIVRAQQFYERHGGKTIILARFLPIVRTFAPYVAGMAGMPYRRFVWFNVVGALLWVLSLTLLGYLLASIMPDVEKNILWVILIVVALSFVPGVIEVWRARRAARREREPGGQGHQGK